MAPPSSISFLPWRMFTAFITNSAFMASNDPGNSPWGRGKNKPTSIEDFLDQLQNKFNFNLGNKFIIWLVLAAVAGIWAWNGFQVINRGELGVVRRFGAIVETPGPGLQFNPWPVYVMDVVKVDQVRSMELGFRSERSRSSRGGEFLRESLMITGDENLVNLQMVVQYRIDNLPNYLFKVWDPLGTPEGDTLRDAAETALRGVVGSMEIDEVLRGEGRSVIQIQTKKHLQELLNTYQTGLLITEVKLQLVEAPEPVKAAFDDVNSAKEDRERIINEAKAYQADILPKARGEAQKILRSAEAYRENKIREAEGDTARFLSQLREYRKAKTVTRRRLYLETMSEVLSNVDKVIISGRVGSRALPLLPLLDMVGGGGGTRSEKGGGQ